MNCFLHRKKDERNVYEHANHEGDDERLVDKEETYEGNY